MQRFVLTGIVALGVVACADGQAQQQLPQPEPQQRAALPSPDVQSAGYVVAGCRAFIERRMVDAFQQGKCAGQVEAAAVFASGICHPAEVTVGQMIRVVTLYIDQRPARLHEPFLLLARDAMREAWPCRR